MRSDRLPWYKAKVKQINDTKDSIYEAQCEEAKDGITPPVIKRDPMSDRYKVVDEEGDDEEPDISFHPHDFRFIDSNGVLRWWDTDESEEESPENYLFWGLG